MPNIDFALWAHQERLTTKAIELIRGGAKSILINSPVGSGKTAMGLTIAERLVHEFNMVNISWSAMRRNLLKQAERDRVKFGFDVQLTPVSMFEKNPAPCDVLFVDEAHHDATNSMNTIHAIAKPKLVIGMSATVKRSDRVGLCFEHTLDDVGMQELIDAGVLSQYEHFTIPEWTPEGIANCFLREPDRWGQSIVFFHRFDDCAALARRLVAAGIATDIVTGDTDRDTQIDAFEAGDTQVLINMMVLTEGFDSPALRTAFVRPSSKSPTIQMGGRVLRKHADIPFKQIVQCARTKAPFTRLATAQQSHKWQDGKWVTVSKAVNLEPILHRNRKLMIQAVLTNQATSVFTKRNEQRARPARRTSF